MTMMGLLKRRGGQGSQQPTQQPQLAQLPKHNNRTGIRQPF